MSHALVEVEKNIKNAAVDNKKSASTFFCRKDDEGNSAQPVLKETISII